MADEATDALIPEAPSTEAAAPTEAPAPDPFEKRYNDLRSEFDRKNALLDRATKQGDIEAIRALGFDYEEPEDPTPEYVEEDPYAAEFAQTKKELDELKQWRQAQEAERVASGIRSHVQSLAQEAGLELSDYDKEVIFRAQSTETRSTQR
jgi:Skp family chaperone for outer membrane proteins